MNLSFRIWPFVALALTIRTFLEGTLFTWTAFGPQPWEFNGNWSPAGGPPGAADTALFHSLVFDTTVEINANDNIDSILLQLSGSHALAFSQNVAGKVLIFSSGGGIQNTTPGTNPITFQALPLQITTSFTVDQQSSSSPLTLGSISEGVAGSTFRKISNAAVAIASGSTWSFTGQTSINAGTLNALGANVLSSSSNHTISSGATLALNNNAQTIGSLAGAGSVTLGSGTLTTGSTSSTTFSGGITGTGGLTKTGATTFTLSTASSANSYSGATNVSAGTLQGGAANAFSANSDHTVAGTLDLNNFSQAIGSLAGAGSVTLGSDTLTTGSTSSTTFSGGITGTGGLTKTGATTFTLSTASSANSYSGATNVSVGTLQGGAANAFSVNSDHTVAGTLDLNNFSQAIGSLAGAGSVTLGSGTLTTGSTNGSTFSGGIMGTGGLTKVGSNTFTLTGTSNYSGATTVSQGILSVNGSLTTGPVSVGSGTTLKGTGTIIGSVTVGAAGTISPGNSIGTLNVTGNVVQGNNSTLQSEINPTTSSLLNITGSYTIGSSDTLSITIDPGVYPATHTYTLVTASTGVSGQFATVTLSLPTFRATVSYDVDDVLLTEISAAPFSNVVTSGNAGAVATCLDTLSASDGSDLSLVIAELRMIPTIEGLEEALALMQPSQFTAFALAEENATLYTNGSIFERLIQDVQSCAAHERNTSFWITPFGALTHQSRESAQPGFYTDTAGITAGADFSPSNWTFGGAAGYSYVHLRWKHGRGCSDMNNGYGALYAGVAGKYAYLFGSVIGGYNYYDAARRVEIGDKIIIPIIRTAKSSHHGWQGSGHLQGGLSFGKKVQFSPFAQTDFIYIHENGFKEHGANSIDLHVKKKNSNFLDAEAGVEVSRCFSVSKNKVSPSIGLSGIREWRFKGKHYNSSFTGSSCVMHTSGANPDRTLLSGMLGCTLLLPNENRTLSFEYKGKWGENFQDNRLLAQFLCRF